MSEAVLDEARADSAEDDRAIASRVRRRYTGQYLLLAAGLASTLALGVYALQIGAGGIDLQTTLGAIWSQITGAVPADGETARRYLMVWELRVPRVALAVLGGAALAIAGVLFQGLLRNPLVSPFTLGIAPAAAFGAALAILFFGTSGSSGLPLVLGALTSALICTVIVLSLASTKRMEATTLILLGMALTQLFTALTAGLQYFADEETLASIVRWTWGSVNGSVWYQVITLLVVLAIALPYIQFRSGAVNAIAFAGDDAARSLGVPVSRVRLEVIFVAVLITAVTISFTGIIGFVGLVGPHIARLLIGANHRFLIPFSAFVGALLLVVSDAVGRVVIDPAVVPVGIVDALIGAPIFLYLILSRKRSF